VLPNDSFCVFFLEGAPVFVGSSIAVATILAMNAFNPWLILLLFLSSAIVGIFLFLFGLFLRGENLKIFSKDRREKIQKPI